MSSNSPILLASQRIAENERNLVAWQKPTDSCAAIVTAQPAISETSLDNESLATGRSLSDQLVRIPKLALLQCGCNSGCEGVRTMLPDDGSRLDEGTGLAVLQAAFRIPGFHVLRGFCRTHLRVLVSSTLGLKNSYPGSSNDSIIRRARMCFKYLHVLPELRRHYCDWFVRDCQTNDIRLRLGGAKYEALPLSAVHVNPEKIFKRFASEEHWKDFQRDGTVNVSGVFSYMWDAEGISDIIDAEFDMYRHHYHAAGNPGKRLGWSRNMWFSLIQQVVRQDPMYYCLMVAARPDRNWKLISYPYYTKDTELEESTGFTHLDLNLRNFVETGKGSNVVQGALALTDETDENCTVLVHRFQNHIQQWWQDLQARSKGDSTCKTTDIKGLYTAADQQKYGALKPVPCRRGAIRITLPQIVHGSTAKSDSRRKVVFPWFTGITEDHETLDNPESETWSQVAACHRDLVPCRLSPSGRSVFAYQRGHHFQAAVPLPSTSHVGDALVGRHRWSSPQVIMEARILFGEDATAAQTLVAEIRQRLLAAYRTAWEDLKKVEKELYGYRSFFHITTNNHAAPPADGYSSDGGFTSDFSD